MFNVPNVSSRNTGRGFLFSLQEISTTNSKSFRHERRQQEHDSTFQNIYRKYNFCRNDRTFIEKDSMEKVRYWIPWIQSRDTSWYWVTLATHSSIGCRSTIMQISVMQKQYWLQIHDYANQCNLETVLVVDPRLCKSV